MHIGHMHTHTHVHTHTQSHTRATHTFIRSYTYLNRHTRAYILIHKQISKPTLRKHTYAYLRFYEYKNVWVYIYLYWTTNYIETPSKRIYYLLMNNLPKLSRTLYLTFYNKNSTWIVLQVTKQLKYLNKCFSYCKSAKIFLSRCRTN